MTAVSSLPASGRAMTIGQVNARLGAPGVLWPDTLPRNPAGRILKSELKRAFTSERNSLTHL